MKRKFDPILLQEEIDKFKLLSEYDFYQEKKEEPEYKEIILGSQIDETDEEPSDLEPIDEPETNSPNPDETKDSVDKITADLDIDNIDQEDTLNKDVTQPPLPNNSEESNDNDVEIDVTTLVNKTEEAKKSSDIANQNTEKLLSKLTDLESRLSKMDSMVNRINGLEKEIIKRNPTPIEKLEMMSLNSYPYSQKLTDYWADKEGTYDVTKKEEKPKVYQLTKSDINSSYSDMGIKKSFEVPENYYDEDDIQDYDEENI